MKGEEKMSLRKCTPCDCDGICPYDAEYSHDCEYWCGAEEPEDIPDIEEESEEQTSSAPEEESESEDAWRVLLQLRDAQQSILSAIWDVDDQTNLEKALTLIGDKMDEISKAYGLPIMSEQ